MLIITSLSPNHINQSIQIESIASWNKFGNVISMNTEKEIESLELVYKNILYQQTDKTIKHLVGKSLVLINSMIDYAKEKDEDLLIINSDIILHSLPPLSQDGITIFSRWDYTYTFSDASIFPMGFDAFYIPKHFLNIFPPSLFAMGSPWHDFYTPYVALERNIPIYWPQGKHIFHKLHKTQYNVDEWMYIGEHFRLFFKFSKNINMGQIATDVLLEIKQNAIK